MPRAPPSLLAAARSAKGEDRLTALLAVVLEGHLEFANRLLADVGLLPAAGNVRASQVEVSTEVRTARGRRVDMQVLALDQRGSVIARLWSEHKTGAPYEPEQLPDYHRALSAFPEATQLLTIVQDQGDAPQDEADRWLARTWSDVAQLAWRAGKAERGADGEAERGGDWRRQALGTDALARERLLLEFVSYLEEEYEAVIETALAH